MRYFAATMVVLLGGFAIMVLEIVGARYLPQWFGSAFYVWVSQIGVILGALALGYSVGGAMADRFRRLAVLGWMLAPAGVLTYFIPVFAPRLLDAITLRHPADQPIPILWQKLDPALGSLLVFFLPCFALAMVSPFMVRVVAQRLTHVGRISGLIYAASTVGSIAGVFVSGYVLLENMPVSDIFRATGAMTILLGLLCVGVSSWFSAQTVVLPPS